MGFDRQVRRARLKAAYDRFGKSWREEQRRQKKAIAKGEEIPRENLIVDRSRPTFAQWLTIVERFKKEQLRKQREQQVIPIEEFVDPDSLKWDDEGGSTPGATKDEQTSAVQGQSQQAAAQDEPQEDGEPADLA